MNLIEAWKKAIPKGSRIARKIGVGLTVGDFKSINHLLDLYPSSISNGDWLADDWDIVKVKKKVIIDNVMKCGRGLLDGNSDNIADILPDSGTSLRITIEWEE